MTEVGIPYRKILRQTSLTFMHDRWCFLNLSLRIRWSWDYGASASARGEINCRNSGER